MPTIGLAVGRVSGRVRLWFHLLGCPHLSYILVRYMREKYSQFEPLPHVEQPCVAKELQLLQQGYNLSSRNRQFLSCVCG